MTTWRLRTSLSLLLVASTAVTFTLVGSVILLYRIPVINNEAEVSVQAEASEKARLLEFYLTGVEAQLHPVAEIADNGTPKILQPLLEAIVKDGDPFLGVYLVDGNGIIRAAAFAEQKYLRAHSVIGADLSRTPLFANLTERTSQWSDKYLSASSGKIVIGVGYRHHQWRVIAELAPETLRDSVAAIAGSSLDAQLIVDQNGEWIADNQKQAPRRENLGADPVVKAALESPGSVSRVAGEKQDSFVGSARPLSLGWVFIVTRPAGLDNPDIHRTVALLGFGFVGALLVGLLIAPWWARSLSAPMQRLIRRTHCLAAGDYSDSTREMSHIVELNELDKDLRLMTDAIRERETSLARSEERLRATIENPPAVAIQWFDRDGICRYWNPASTNIYGYTETETVGRSLSDLIYTQEQQQEFVSLIREIERTGRPVPAIELQLRHKDGYPIVVLCSIFAIPGPAGDQQFVCLDIDITERKRAADSVQASKQELEFIFNASPVPMSVCDMDRGARITKVNDAWVRQFGRKPADVYGKTGLDIDLYLNPADRETFFGAFAHNNKTFDDMECWFKHADGTPILCRVSARIIEVSGQRLMVAASEDITTLRNMATELRQMNEELEARVIQRTAAWSEANAELELALVHLEQAQDELIRSEKQAALGRMVAAVAHELNTPIGNGLMAMSTLEAHQKEFKEAMSETLKRSQLEAFVGNVGTAAEIGVHNLRRAAHLISSFKQVAVDQTSSQRRKFDLKQLIEELLTALQPMISRSGNQVTANIPPGIKLDSHPGSLDQVLSNLIENAFIHAFGKQPGGLVSIVAETTAAGRVRLLITDNGCGIPPENLSRIFDPFFTTRLGQGGSGLGLNIVQNIVNSILGGDIEAESSPGNGTRFTLTLPVAAPQQARGEESA
ncbi:MAG: PAS domain S-box protein [Zoogloeaceae bacterium]|nr:PAS domain S-box protein [Zoogloeaceae bacterium]